MYKAVYWIVGVLGTLLVVFGVWFIVQLLHPAAPATTTTQTSNNQNGNFSNTVDVTNTAPQAAGVRVPIRTGGSIKTKDFIHNGETAADVVNPGLYYLAGAVGYCLANGTCPAGYNSPDFTVTYNSSTGLFNVVLATEPIAQARQAAGAFLMSRLGLKDFEVCSLLYYVSVPSTVNSTYAGKNLGFDFCSGATLIAG